MMNFDHIERTITMDEFNFSVKEGKKYVILDDCVVDVGKFKFNHPGGVWLLDHNIGNDISKFFYGAYSMEAKNSFGPHLHSNTARSIIMSLAICRLEREAPNVECNVDIKLSKKVTQSVTTFTL